MKNGKIISILLLYAVMVGMCATVSAEAIGDNYSIGGFGAGWVLVVIAIVGFILIYTKIISKNLGKKLVAVFALFLLVGLGMQFIQVDTSAETGDVTTNPCECPDFEIVGTATTSGTDYITTTVWDEDDLTLTIPLTVQDSSDGNLTGAKAGMNITFDPVATGCSSTDITTVFFSSDYLMKYGGEYVLDEDTSGYEAEWTTADGTVDYEDSIDITAGSTGYAQIDYVFNNGTAGNWVDELSAVGDSVTWHINMWNDCNTWSEQITVTAIVVSYTA